MNQNTSLTKYCRLCTKPKDNLINLLTNDSSCQNLVKIIYERLDMKVSESDSLPKMICLTCKGTVEEFESFRQSCVLAEKSFRTSVQATTSLPSAPQGTGVMAISRNQRKISLNNDLESSPQHIQNIKVEVEEYDPESDTCPETVCHETGNPVNVSTVKEPQKEDYILVKEENFTLNDWDERSANAFVEFSRPMIEPSDRALVENVRKRVVLPQMWDVYEKQIDHNTMNVIMRRYIISKGAFPCSLCDKCIQVEYDNGNVCTENETLSNRTETEDSADVSHQIGGKDCTMSNGSEDGVALTYVSEANESGSLSNGTGEYNGDVLMCEFCQKPFPRLHSLKRHLHTHFGNKTLLCKDCGRYFSRKEHLVRHMLLHTGGRPYKCQTCKKAFTRKEHLTRHQLIHDCDPLRKGKPDNLDSGKKAFGGERVLKSKAHVCDICGNKFNKKEPLMRHLRRTHGLNYPDNTTVSNCSTSTATTNKGKDCLTTSNGSLTKTSESVSTNVLVSEERTIILCNLCPRTFSREEHLARHLKIHVRDSMFVNESRVPGTDITMSLINSRN